MSGAATQETPNRGIFTLCVMLATIMQALDTTIANVALPYMQGNLAATQDQINWVLTSYIVAAAIMTPVTGFLAARLGRKRLFLIAVVGFTVASVLCGIAQSLPQMVLFRLAQGVFGAPLVPMSIGAARYLSEGEARLGNGDVGRRRHGRADPWAHARRLAHRILQLALGFNQRADRHRDVPRPLRLSVGEQAPTDLLRLDGLCHAQHRRRRAAAFSRSWRAARLIRLARDHCRADDLRTRLLRVHRPHLHDRAAVHRSAHFQGPHFRCWAVLYLCRRHHPARLAGAVNAVPTEPDELSGAHRRHGSGAARHRDHGGDDDCRPSDQPHRSAPAVAVRICADRRGFMGDDRLYTRCVALHSGAHRHRAGPRSGLSLRAAVDDHVCEADAGVPHPGTALFSLMRNLGSSLGISVVIFLLTRNTQAVHSQIVEHMT